MRAAALALLVLLLSGCSPLSQVQAVDTAGDGVTYEFALDRQAEAARQATLYCANLGRSAVLRQITRDDEGGIAAFECR